MIDCLMNGFLNLVYVVASGGLICTLPMNSKRRISIQDSSEHGQLPWSPKSRLSCGQVEDPTMLAEPSADPIEAETHMLSIPQAQLARRYQELASTPGARLQRRLRESGLFHRDFESISQVLIEIRKNDLNF